MYHNTTYEAGAALEQYKAQAVTQDKAVLCFFQIMPDREYTPFEVWDNLIQWDMIDPRTPVTSIRRSMSNLVKRGKLNKINLKKQERLGRPNCVWKLKARFEQTKLFA